MKKGIIFLVLGLVFQAATADEYHHNNLLIGNQEDFEREAFSVVPGFFGLSQSLDNWTLGAALMVTDFSKERSLTVMCILVLTFKR